MVKKANISHYSYFCKIYTMLWKTTSTKSIRCPQAVAAGALLALSGCALQATLQVDTNPTGGYISEVDTGFVPGIAPVSIYYEPSSLTLRDAKGCYLVRGMNVRWVSGATASVNPISLCGSAYDNYNITINRPANAPDLDKDLQFAVQVQNMLSQQAQAEAARQATALQIYNSTLNNTVNCTSIPIGNQVHTNCR
jgi:hypothetical protein